MVKYLRKEMLGFLLNIAGLFTVSGLQVLCCLTNDKGSRISYPTKYKGIHG